MIITENFVLLNLPKTGSTYARKVLKKIYSKRINKNWLVRKSYQINLISKPYTELLLPNIRLKKGLRNNLNPHGVYSQIPNKHKHKIIVSIVRNPYDRLISGFEFGFWKDNPALEKQILKEKFPNFPDLNIDEYIDYLKYVSNLSYAEKPKNLKTGVMSLQFIYFFFKNPEEVISKLNDDYLKSETRFIKDIAPITFLKQESLNQDLYHFLLEQGFSNKEASLALNHSKVNETKNKSNRREDLLTTKVINYIEEYESFYLHVLRKNNIYYTRPNKV